MAAPAAVVVGVVVVVVAVGGAEPYGLFMLSLASPVSRPLAQVQPIRTIPPFRVQMPQHLY